MAVSIGEIPELTAPTLWSCHPSQAQIEVSGNISERLRLARSMQFLLNSVCPILVGQSSSNHASRILWRIGSVSSDAEVFEIEHDHLRAALKVMPWLDSGSHHKNQNEIEIAIRASQLVRDRVSEHFLLVYGSGTCPNVNFYPGSKFTAPAVDYASLLSLQERYPEKARRIQLMYSQMEGSDRSSRVAERLSLAPTKAPARADFLISELGSEDVKQWSSRCKHEPEVWFDIAQQAITAIYHLHKGLSVSHNDLHPGNLLLVGSRLVIHDFGRSTGLNSSNWKDDYQELLYRLQELTYIPSEVKKNLALTLEDVVSHQGSEDRLVETLEI
jgi:hypothetical protein